jgi:hypothetical protein
MGKSAILFTPLLLLSITAMAGKVAPTPTSVLAGAKAASGGAARETGKGPRLSGSQGTPATTAASPQNVNLGLIVVKGKRLLTLPLPVKLQMIKTALHQPINFRQENLSKLVCRFNGDPRDAMRQPLHCETNCDILMAQNAFNGFFIPCDIGESAMLNERLAAYINTHRINRRELMALLEKLPPPGGSYTFQVKSHGKVVARWVVEGGQVVKVEVSNKHKN